MKKNIFISFVIILMLCSFCVRSFAENTDSLKDKRDELKENINSTNSDLELVESELSTTIVQIQELSSEIEKVEAEVQVYKNKVDELTQSISVAQEELKIAEEKYMQQKELLETRLVALYEAGETTYLDFLLQESKSLGDFLSNYFLISELAQYDMEMLDEFENQKNKIEITRNKLELEKEEAKEIKEKYENSMLILQNTKAVKSEQVSKLSEEEKTLNDKIEEYKKEMNRLEAEIYAAANSGSGGAYIGGEMSWPTPGYTYITSSFGMREHPITGVYKSHTGVDIGAPMGAKCVAANSGTVIKAGYNGGYGKMVMVDHGGGIVTLYAHGSEILVSVGEKVSRDEQIMKVGSTGNSTGPHLHFEVRINGSYVNPLPYITS